MNPQEQIWIEAFAHRLLTQCPRVGAPDAGHIGESLWRDRPWQGLPPDTAAEKWLAQVGLIAAAESEPAGRQRARSVISSSSHAR